MPPLQSLRIVVALSAALPGLVSIASKILARASSMQASLSSTSAISWRWFSWKPDRFSPRLKLGQALQPRQHPASWPR